MRKKLLFIFCAAALLVLASCSTTRLLSDGQYRLVKNEIIVVGDNDFETSKIAPYIRQKPSWNPMIYVYNWSGRDSSWLSRSLRKIGTAPVVFDSHLVSTSAENMTRQMEYLGYYHSSVLPEIEIKGKSASVKYVVRPGKRYVVSDFGYDVPNDSTLREIFFRDTVNVTIKKGQFLSLAALEAETIRSAAYLRNNGYFDIDKNVFSFLADTLQSSGTVSLVMKIDLKQNKPVQYKFGKVAISYPSSLKFRSSVLKKLNTIKPNHPYSETIINNTYSRLSALDAFSGVRVTVDRSPDSLGLVDCNIELTPSKQRGVKLKFEGSSNSNGLIGISPELTWYNKNIFHGSETLNLSFLGDWQFKPGTDIKSTEFGVSGSIQLPRFLLLSTGIFKDRVLPTTILKASFNTQNRPEYKRELFSTSYTYLWSMGRMYYQLTPIGFSFVKLHDIDSEFYEGISVNPFLRNAYQDHLDIGSSMTLYYTTDASVVPQGSYYYARLQMDLSGNVLSLFNSMLNKNESGAALIWNTPYSQYVRGELSLGRTWTLWEGGTIATRLLAGAGYAYGNSEALPFEKHFYSGGANSLRGWQARGVGPGYAKMDKTFVIPSQTGDLRLEANVELRFKLYGLLSGAVFADAGNIWTINKGASEAPEGRFCAANFPGSIAADWGLGLRFNMKVILLRLDMGLRIHDPALEGSKWLGPGKWFHSGGNAIHIAVGYPF